MSHFSIIDIHDRNAAEDRRARERSPTPKSRVVVVRECDGGGYYLKTPGGQRLDLPVASHVKCKVDAIEWFRSMGFDCE